jgi:hypothetical protein
MIAEEKSATRHRRATTAASARKQLPAYRRADPARTNGNARIFVFSVSLASHHRLWFGVDV